MIMDSMVLLKNIEEIIEKLKVLQEEVQQDLLSVEMRLDKYLYESDAVGDLLKLKS